MTWRSRGVATALLALVTAGVVGGCSSARKGASSVAAPSPPTPREDCRIDGVKEPLVAEDDASIGPADAPLLVVEFTDLECPHCARHTATLRRMLDTYGRRMRLVVKHHPLANHRFARVAAEAAVMVQKRAGPTAFFLFQDAIFRDQGALSEPMLIEWAKLAGVSDTAAFRDELDQRVDAGRVREHLALAARLPLGGTPSTIVNGTILVGARRFEEFRAVADASLAQAMGTGCDATRRTLRIEPPPPTRERWAVVDGSAPARGPADAAVTLVVFTEHECKACSSLHATLGRLERRYGPKVRVVTHLVPGEQHEAGKKAATLARLARRRGGDAAFERAVGLLFQRGPDLDDLALLAVSKEVDVDPGEVPRAVEGRWFALEEERALDLADDVGVGGLPQVFVNGVRVAGAKLLDDYIDVIDEELASPIPRSILAESGKRTMPPEKKLDAPPAREGAPSWGPARAKVTIELFSDFECPYCRRVSGTLARIRAHFGDDVRVVWHDRPLSNHANAMLAAEAAREAFAQAGPRGFFAMHDALFAHQAEKDGLSRARLEEYARDAGLDIPRFRAALDDRRHRSGVEAEDSAAEAAGINATPTMIVNGYLLRGSESFRHIRRVVELARAEP